MNRSIFHPGTSVAGLPFAVFGLVFLLEALGAWTFQLNDLRVLGPVALIVLGAGVLLSSLWARSHDGEPSASPEDPLLR